MQQIAVGTRNRAAGLTRARPAVESPGSGETLRERVAPLMMLTGAVLVVLIPAVVVEERVFMLKLAVAAVLSILPGWIYLEFIQHKGRSLYDEYVINLFRLRIDETANLPMPPQHTSYYPAWKAAHGALISGLPKKTRDNLYRRKFENIYGAGAVSTYEVIHESARRRLHHRTETFSPVLMATFIIALGWTFVMSPELARVLFSLGLNTDAVAPAIPEAMLFGFLGAYAFILQDLVRRYFREDLRAGAYMSGAARIVFVALIVFAGNLMWSDSFSATEGLFAFMVGFFPMVGLQAIQSAISRPLGRLMPSLRPDYPLSRLQGLNFWYEARLTEEGIDDMQNLASANLVDLMLHTRAPVQRLVDWVDQACLHLHLPTGEESGRKDPAGPDTPILRLRRLGIRTATDLEAAAHRLSANPHFIDEFNRAVGVDQNLGPAALESILSGLHGEAALHHVRSFRAQAWLAVPVPANAGRAGAQPVGATPVTVLVGGATGE